MYYESYKNIPEFFACALFEILNKVYLEIFKKLFEAQFFCMSTFSNFKKSILTNLQEILQHFFACPLFQILKKVYLQIFKKPSAIFFLIPFSKYLKKVYLQIFRNSRSIFLFIPIFKYSKKYTYKSERNLGQLFACQLSQIFKKSVLTNLKET